MIVKREKEVYYKVAGILMTSGLGWYLWSNPTKEYVIAFSLISGMVLVAIALGGATRSNKVVSIIAEHALEDKALAVKIEKQRNGRQTITVDVLYSDGKIIEVTKTSAI